MDGRTDKQKNRQTDRQTDRHPDNRQTDTQTTDRQIKPLKSSRFLEISRANYREQISRLEIRDLKLIFSVSVPENGNGKIKKLNSYAIDHKTLFFLMYIHFFENSEWESLHKQCFAFL
jgi:hypothetical protein